MKQSLISKAYIVSGMPHILLAHEQSPAWGRLHQAFAAARAEIEREEADVILYFSTQWLSILGYMFQADPHPEWVHVDQNWHQLGAMPYSFSIDTDLAAAYADEVARLGYKTRLINYRGFPIDTGTIVAQKLLNPDNRLKAAIVSCNMYSEKEETTRLGQAAACALQKSGKKAIAVLVSHLSHRFHVQAVQAEHDAISSKKDDEWNRKILDMLGAGDVEDVAQCAREFARQANGDMKFKGIWWLNGLLGQSNEFDGKVLGYEAVMGSGCTVVSLTPTAPVVAPDPDAMMGSEEGSQAEMMEELSDFEGQTQPHAKSPSAAPAKAGGRELHAAAAIPAVAPAFPDFEIVSQRGAEPVGSYPHARRYGDWLLLSGIGPRRLGAKTIPGVTFGAQGEVVAYDIREQTRAVIENVRKILEDAGSSLEKVLDIQVFLTNMKSDFKGYNEVYNATFASIRPTRTTVEVGALPTPIAVEFKVLARP